MYISMFLQWLFVVILCTSVVLLLLLSANLWDSYRNLKSTGRPGKILYKEIVGAVLDLFNITFDRKEPSNKTELIKNRLIWVEWDIRWGPHDTSLGSIQEVLPNEGHYQLLISLSKPIVIPFFKEEKLVEKIIIERCYFKPDSKSVSMKRYNIGAVWGMLIPLKQGIQNKVEREVCKITCKLVVI